MNKIVIIIAVIILGVIGWMFYTNSTDTVDYVATVTEEVEALETQLAEIDAAVSAGTLSEAQAVEARTNVMGRLEAIEAAADSSARAELSSAQRAQLAEGLDRLKSTLIQYRDTLIAVDVNAEGSASAGTPGRTLQQGNGGGALVVAFITAIDAVESNVEEVVTDYEPDETTEEALAEIENDLEADAVVAPVSTTTDETATGTAAEAVDATTTELLEVEVNSEAEVEAEEEIADPSSTQ